MQVPDRWVLWPAALAIPVAVGLALLWQWPGAAGSIAILLSLVVGPIAALAVLITAAVLLFRRRPRKAISVVLVLIVPAALWSPLSLTADTLHLALTAGFGAGQIGVAQTLRPGGPTVHDWSVEMDGGPRTFLIFDATDAIAAPTGPGAEELGSVDKIEQACAGRARHLMSHYYRCSF